MENQNQISFEAALVKAQSEFKPVFFDKAILQSGGKEIRNKYASLKAYLDAVQEALNENGIFLSFPVSIDGGKIEVECRLIYRDGKSLSTKARWDAGQNIQQAGGVISYLKRYLLCSLLGVASGEEDDDGETAIQSGKNPVPAKAPPAAPPPAAPPPAPPPWVAKTDLKGISDHSSLCNALLTKNVRLHSFDRAILLKKLNRSPWAEMDDRQRAAFEAAMEQQTIGLATFLLTGEVSAFVWAKKGGE